MSKDNLMALYWKRGYKQDISKFMTEIKQEHKSMSLPGETFKEYLERVLK